MSSEKSKIEKQIASIFNPSKDSDTNEENISKIVR